jgi:hypothetical protein
MGRGTPPPPSRIPPYYTVRMSYRGDNPVNEIKIFLGKICPFLVFIIMDRKKQIIFRYFDMIYSGYKKRTRRPVYTPSPHVLYEYMNDDGRIAFEYDTESESIRFDIGDFTTVKNMFGMYEEGLIPICKEYVADKFGEPKSPYMNLFLRNLN